MNTPVKDRPGIGPGGWIVAGLSFIPLIGVPLGLAAIIWGLISNRRGAKIVALLGLGGILCTVAIYGSLFYFGFHQRGGIYDDLRGQMATSEMNQLVPYIELYKQQNGHYPAKLEDIQPLIPPNTAVMITDPTDLKMSADGPRSFFYEPSGDDHYLLRGVGVDGQAFTADDILPVAMPRTGLLLERAPAPAAPVTAPEKSS